MPVKAACQWNPAVVEELGQAQENQRSTPEDKGSDAAAFQQVNDRLEKERAKGLATHNQHTIWDKILEMRILLQKSLSMSQQLPIEQDLQAAKSYSRSISDMLEQLIQASVLSGHRPDLCHEALLLLK